VSIVDGPTRFLFSRRIEPNSALRMPRPTTIIAAFLVLSTGVVLGEPAVGERSRVVRDRYGAIIRGDVTARKLALVFTGDERGESTAPILDVLKERGLKAGFFVTGNVVRDPKLRLLLKRAIEEGHYLGPHSDSHPLYCDWEEREKTLVTEKFFKEDLQKNLDGLQELGPLRGRSPPATRRGEMPRLFIPPYEWFNAEQVRWSEAMGVTLINFTPGSGSNRDYAPEGDRVFVPSRKIFDGILAYEQRDPHGLNGFVLLLHLGSGRKDPFHPRLGALCDELAKRGYEIVRVDELLSSAEEPQRGDRK
jgi:peptidoglycan/xylan/chitin deacetylase (PgdA/CDA1 family)